MADTKFAGVLTGRARSATLARRIREGHKLAAKKKTAKKAGARKTAKKAVKKVPAKKAAAKKALAAPVRRAGKRVAGKADKPVGKSGLSASRLRRLQEAMDGYVARGEVAGVVTLVHRHGETAHAGVAGWQDKEARVPMKRDSLFRIASMTKPVVSVATMMLVEEGLLRLSDPIGRWLPELADMKVLPRPDAPLSEARPAERPISVRDLLTHRSGLSYVLTAEGPLAGALAEFNELVYPKIIGTDEWLARLGQLPLSYPPGQRWHYGLSTDVLGLLLGRVTGTSFAEVLDGRIFQPLGMKDTGFWVPEKKWKRFGPAYTPHPETGQRIVVDPARGSRWQDPRSFPSGGAGLVSTIDDYLKFGRMMLGGGAADGVRLLSRKSVELMTANVLSEQERNTPFLGLPFWAGRGFGLGFGVVHDIAQYDAYASAGQFGWPGAYGTFWAADPAEDMVMLMMIQLYFGRDCKIGLDFQTLVYQSIVD